MIHNRLSNKWVQHITHSLQVDGHNIVWKVSLDYIDGYTCRAATVTASRRWRPCSYLVRCRQSYGLGDGWALLRLYSTFGIRSAGLLWLRICSWHPNRDSAGVRFNAPFHRLVWRPPFELASSAAWGGHPLLSLVKRSKGRKGLKISERNLPPSLLSPSGHPFKSTFRRQGVFDIFPEA